MKLLKTFLTAAAIICAVTASATEQNSYTAKKLEIVKSIYDEYAKSPPLLLSQMSFSKVEFTPSFNALLKKDEEMSKGEIACLDYDYIIQGQDFDGKEIGKTVKITPQEDGRIKVTFTNFNEPKTLYYVFSCENGKCLIDDIIEPTGSFKKSLNECLEDIKNEQN